MSVDIDKNDQDTKDFLTKDISFLHRSLEDDIQITKKIDFLCLHFVMTEETPNYPIYSIIVNNNAYAICKKNMEIILHDYDKNITMPINNYYTLICELENKAIKEYIKQDLELFVKDVTVKKSPLAQIFPRSNLYIPGQEL